MKRDLATPVCDLALVAEKGGGLTERYCIEIIGQMRD
jgi:hypothetical protein